MSADSRMIEDAPRFTTTEQIGRAMLALRAFMFERVYLGPHAQGEHERAHAAIRRIFDRLLERGDDADAIVAFVAGMTDRFALAFAENPR